MSESSSLVASSSMTNRAKQVFERFRESAIEVPARRLANAGMQITGLTKALDENRKEWHAFAKYVEDSITRIHDLPHTAFLAPTAQERLEQLLSTLKELLAEVNSYEERGVVQKLALTGASEHAPGEMRKKLDEALFLSNLEFTIANGVELAKVVGTLDDMRQALSALSSTLSEQTPLREPLPNEIMALPYGRGMSWDPEKMCLPGTRVELLDEIWNWINAPNDGSGAKLFWLVDVAGSGKTTVAHTVSNRAAEAGQLLLSYFFTRSDSQNSVASTFVTTLATHMARHSHHTATRMASRLRADISLSSAPVARQFRDLIVQSQLQDTDDDDRAKDPQVIVIDALDECTDRGEAMVRILLSAMQELPSNIRIFITSRPVPEMLDSLEYLTRVRKREIGLYTEANFRDLRLYMTQRLPLVIRRTRNACDIDDIHFRLHRRAEGLFLWVSTVTTFLHRCINPDRQLEAILSSNNNDSEADKPMDSLYELVLSDCPWDDVDFREGYRRYMGLMLAAAKPLTYSIFEQLNPDANIPSKAVFERLSALLGVGRLDEDGNLIRDEDVTIRVLHSSLQTYLFHRAPPRYRFHYQSLHAQMAQNCLKILTKDLDELYRSLSVHGCWWRALTGWSEPNISVEDCVSLLAEVAEFEEIHVCDLNPHLRDRMQYACCDGIRHLIRVQSPAPNLLHLLQNLLATGVLSLVCSSFILCCQNWLADLLLWLKKHDARTTPLYQLLYSSKFALMLEGIFLWAEEQQRVSPFSLGINNRGVFNLAKSIAIIQWDLHSNLQGHSALADAALARALHALARVHPNWPAKMSLLQESMKVYRRLVTVDHEQYRDLLERCVHTLAAAVTGKRTVDHERHYMGDEVSAALEEALGISGICIIDRNPTIALRPEVLESICWYALQLSPTRTCATTARILTETLLKQGLVMRLSELEEQIIRALMHLSQLHWDTGHQEAAIQLATKVVSHLRDELKVMDDPSQVAKETIIRPLWYQQPRGTFLQHRLKDCLQILMAMLQREKKREAALAMARELLTFHRDAFLLAMRGDSEYLIPNLSIVFSAAGKSLILCAFLFPEPDAEEMTNDLWALMNKAWRSFRYLGDEWPYPITLLYEAIWLRQYSCHQEALQVIEMAKVKHSNRVPPVGFPMLPRLLELQAIILFEMGEQQEAIHVALEVLSELRMDDSASIHLEDVVGELACELERSGYREEALLCAEKCLGWIRARIKYNTLTSPALVEPLIAMSKSLISVGRMDEASKAVEEALKIQQERLDMWPRSVPLQGTLQEIKALLEKCKVGNNVWKSK